ncbi:hypothetical protein [Streptomyces diastaticus]|uniref:hypothetical protein n=1 Tax=Streptomyces diastaticus TaxID=1956 RepID=UPI0036605FF0
MTNRRARTYAVCAVKLDEDHTDAAEGTFDAALTNALVAIVAKEWSGKERKKGKTFTKSASELLELIRKKARERPDVVKRVLDEPDVFLIRDPHAEERNLTVEEHHAAEASVASIFSGPWPAPKPYETRVDVGTLLDALDVLITSVVNAGQVLIMTKTSGVVEVSKLHRTRRSSCLTVTPG